MPHGRTARAYARTPDGRTDTRPSGLTRHGRQWAYAGLTSGGLASVVGNVAHTYVPPTGAGGDWTPGPYAIILAAFWPVALFFSIEIMARVDWPQGWAWTTARFAGLGTVAAVAAIVSYRHMTALLLLHGEDRWSAHLGPLAIDGLMALSTLALLALSRAPDPEPPGVVIPFRPLDLAPEFDWARRRAVYAAMATSDRQAGRPKRKPTAKKPPRRDPADPAPLPLEDLQSFRTRYRRTGKLPTFKELRDLGLYDGRARKAREFCLNGHGPP